MNTVSQLEINWAVVFGFIITGLISILGWIIIRWINTQQRKDDENHIEKKEIREALSIDRKTFDEKLEKIASLFSNQLTQSATVFGTQVKEVGENFMREIREIKISMDQMAKEITRLTSTIIQMEKDSTIRYDAINKRMDDNFREVSKKLEDHWTEISNVRAWKHDTDNHLTRLITARAMDDRKQSDEVKETLAVRKEGFERIKILEEKLQALMDKKSRKN